MTATPLAPYLERVQVLAPAVAEDVFRRSAEPSVAARKLAFTAAVGHLHRHVEAVRALDSAPDPTLVAAVATATATLRAAWRPAGALLAEAERLLRDALARARVAPPAVVPAAVVPAADSPGAADPRAALAARLAWHGDPEVAADRRLLLEDADAAISLAAAFAALSRAQAAPFLGGVPLQIARLALSGLDDETRWRVEASARAEAVERELFTDPFGGAMWCALLSPDRLPELLATLAAAPEEELRLAAAGAGPVADPGVVHVLLYRADRGKGVVARLSVRHDPDGRVWGRDERWGRAAWEAVRNAWFAAASLLPAGSVPPDALDAYVIDIDTSARVDGGSLGLPAALAFWSLWTKTGLPTCTAATGAITSRGDVREVDATGLAAKLDAWRAQFDEADVPALVPDQDAAGADVARCVSLAGALAVLGVEPAATTAPSALGSVTRRQAALRACVDAVREQDLRRTPTVSGASPWVTLADRMRLLARSLDGATGVDVDLADARLWCALAYIHGARSGDARALLAEVDPATPRARLLHALLLLNEAIDVPAADEDALEAALAAAPGIPGFEAHALGTRGRFHLHRHRVAVALPLLEAALAAAEPHERPRSRTYLAMGLRMAGRPAEALAELDAAARDLDAHTRPYSASYAAETGMYLAYERARTLLALDRPEDALASIDAALRTEGASGGWWPRLAFLRARAEALRRLGRFDALAAALSEVGRVAPDDPGPYRAIVEGLVAEAHGRDAGIVY